jgi:hypothetical protein
MQSATISCGWGEAGRTGRLTDRSFHFAPLREDRHLTGKGTLFEGVAEEINIHGVIFDEHNLGDRPGSSRRVEGRLLGLMLAKRLTRCDWRKVNSL